VGALAGMGARGSLAKASDALLGMGLCPALARQYEDHVLEGRVLLSLHAEDDEMASKARQILRQTGAEDIFATA
jgi:hypothetical protein